MGNELTLNLNVKKVKLFKYIILSYSTVVAMLVGGFITSITKGLPEPFGSISIYASLLGAIAAIPLIYDFSITQITHRTQLLKEEIKT